MEKNTIVSPVELQVRMWRDVVHVRPGLTNSLMCAGPRSNQWRSIRIEALAQSFDVPIEGVLVKYLIQSRVEGMCGISRQVLGCHPRRGLLRVPLSFAHRHRRQFSTRDRSCRSLSQRFPVRRPLRSSSGRAGNPGQSLLALAPSWRTRKACHGSCPDDSLFRCGTSHG
jgi:hypothetical protein